MEENKQNNSLVKKENSFLTDKASNLVNRIKKIDFLRLGKMTGAGAIALTAFFWSSPFPLVKFGTAVVFGASFFEAGKNFFVKTEPTLLFALKKPIFGREKEEIEIAQDLTNISLMSRMLGYESNEILAMMALHTLVGLENCKQDLKKSNEENPIDEKETSNNTEHTNKVYPQKFSTITHKGNSSILGLLEKLGYIADLKESNEEIKALGVRNGKSYLIMEQIGVGNFKGARNAFKALRSKDEKLGKEMKKYTFRLTDKSIDFESINTCINKEKSGKSIPKEFKMIGRVLRDLKERKIQVERNSKGRLYIKYPTRAENAEINRRRKEAKKEREKKAAINAQVKEATEEYEQMGKDFSERLQKGVDKDRFAKVTEATTSIQPEVGEKAKGIDEQPKDEGKSLDL